MQILIKKSYYQIDTRTNRKLILKKSPPKMESEKKKWRINGKKIEKMQNKSGKRIK